MVMNLLIHYCYFEQNNVLGFVDWLYVSLFFFLFNIVIGLMYTTLNMLWMMDCWLRVSLETRNQLHLVLGVFDRWYLNMM